MSQFSDGVVRSSARLECLEPRQLLAATGAVALDGNGVIQIEGTRSSDAIFLSRYIGKGGILRIEVQMNGRDLGNFRQKDVGGILVRGGLGNDTVTFHASMGAFTTGNGEAFSIAPDGSEHPAHGAVVNSTTRIRFDTGGGASVIAFFDPADIPATIFGGAGNDTITGGPGDDRIEAGGGDDNLFGGEGNDYVAGDNDDDSLSGGIGRDTVDGGDGNDVLLGSGVIVLSAYTGPQRLTDEAHAAGQSVVYRLTGTTDGEDRLSGGHGSDTFRLVGSSAKITDFFEGTDRKE